jgi:hypothetical protein
VAEVLTQIAGKYGERLAQVLPTPGPHPHPEVVLFIDEVAIDPADSRTLTPNTVLNILPPIAGG